MHKKVYLGLGSNLGDRAQILEEAMQKIEAHPSIFSVKRSRIYETAPVSPEPQPDFLNCALSLETPLSPFELLAFLQSVEKELGKVPKPKTAPRRIDIDILFFGAEQIDTPTLQIPHPRWKERLFVLLPLSELVDLKTLFSP